jgi:hypothetical protein
MLQPPCYLWRCFLKKYNYTLEFWTELSFFFDEETLSNSSFSSIMPVESHKQSTYEKNALWENNARYRYCLYYKERMPNCNIFRNYGLNYFSGPKMQTVQHRQKNTTQYCTL